ncbi:hypothetical protein [Vibrio furnissii]|uniref:hypothetical protein n=1 Tax=Vibrio furnissii TaxID=29494 RepID=UPI00155A0018|nr:hypothetical protein [Vibrio furnissii]
MTWLARILAKTLWETVRGLFFQITWKVILERFATRMVIWGLEQLKQLSTNDVMAHTVDDILASLKGKRLKEIDSL